MEITIKFHVNDEGKQTTDFDVIHDGKTADCVTYDEMLGLVSAITMPENRPCLHWLRTPEQIQAWNDRNKPKPESNE